MIYQTNNFEPAQINNGVLNPEGILTQTNPSTIPRVQYKFTTNSGADGVLRLVMIKSIVFKLPIIQEGMNLCLDNDLHVEICCLLRREGG